MEKKQASCTADVFLYQSVNQMHNNQSGQTCSFFHCLWITIKNLHRAERVVVLQSEPGGGNDEVGVNVLPALFQSRKRSPDHQKTKINVIYLFNEKMQDY